MALRDRIPEQLRLRDEVASVQMDDDVAVFPTSEYVLLEISHKVGKINVFKIANTVRDLVRSDKRMVAIRGYGFKGIGLSVRIAHELKKREKRFQYQMTFDTFDAAEANSDRELTSVQIIVIPPT
ncbi:MAG: hypothetical protein ACXAEN_00230 [Candidatus Thorarchaeota archaeon]|jgi:hypothetical protein